MVVQEEVDSNHSEEQCCGLVKGDQMVGGIVKIVCWENVIKQNVKQ